jgi:hypothetical protein
MYAVKRIFFYERREVRVCNDFHLQYIYIYIAEARKNCVRDLYHNQVNTTRPSILDRIKIL